MSAPRLTAGAQQEWEQPAWVLPGVPGNVIKHSADLLAMGIWAPPGPPAHPDPQLAVLTGSCQEKRPAVLAGPVSMSSCSLKSACPRLVLVGGALALRAPGARLAGSMALVRSPQQEAWEMGSQTEHLMLSPLTTPRLGALMKPWSREPVPLPGPLLHNHGLHFSCHLPFLPIA